MIKIAYRIPGWLVPTPVLLTFLAVPYLHLVLLGMGEKMALVLAVGIAAILAGGLVAGRRRIYGWLDRTVRIVERIDPRQWLYLVLGLGLILRICWAGIYKASLQSDFAIYFDLARGLVERRAYGGDGAYLAYWPPGLPLFLAPLIAVFGPQTWIPLLGNLLITALAIVLTARLADGLRSVLVARMAPLLVAIWPANIMSAGLASKEQLLIPLLIGVVLSFLRCRERGSSGYLLLTGVLSGMAALTQPSFILIPVLLVLGEILATGRVRAPLRHSLFVMLGLALVVSPWVWRNYRLLGDLVMISTNGGDVLYRANNPRATGTYTVRGEVELQGLDELERNRRGSELAREWIRRNPRQFLRLAFRKLIAYHGDDNMGAYETLRRGLGIGGTRLIISKILSTGYWMLIWMLILLGWLRNPSAYHRLALSIPLLFFICQMAIDSVYESGSRHHVPFSGLLAMAAALAFERRPLHLDPDR